MTVRMRHTRSHTGHRRSHHALPVAQFVACGHCGFKIRPHSVCINCGKYGGREVIDVLGKLSKKERKSKAKELAAQEDQAARNKPLDAAELSKR